MSCLVAFNLLRQRRMRRRSPVEDEGMRTSERIGVEKSFTDVKEVAVSYSREGDNVFRY